MLEFNGFATELAVLHYSGMSVVIFALAVLGNKIMAPLIKLLADNAGVSNNGSRKQPPECGS